MSDQTVKVSSGKPEDWGVRKADAMHEQHAKLIDKQLAYEADREAARREQLKARRAKRRA